MRVYHLIFDQAAAEVVARTTTVPTQALHMLNSEFINKQAAQFAERLRIDREGDLRGQVELGLGLALSREAAADEVDYCIGFMETVREKYGLDESKAIYEWKYGKQLLYTQVLKEKLGDLLQGAHNLAESVERLHQFGDIFYSEEFLEPRPLLKAMQQERGAILLIDEVDKSDYEFESLLLEILSDYQISIPEIGTVKARTTPMVFLTSNNTRDLSDALKRRCLHLYIPFPTVELEERIIRSRVPDVDEKLRHQLVEFVHSLRQMDLKKIPAISETIDWARSLLLLHADKLDEELVRSTLNVLLKFEDDIDATDSELRQLIRDTTRD